MKVNCMIAAVVVFAVFCFAVNDVRAHMHNMMKYASVMSTDGKYQLQWAYNNETGMLYFKMKCQSTDGWCGVGFADNAVNPTGKNMENFDIAIGGFTDVGYVWDFWSTSKTQPTLDTMQDVTLMAASQMNGYTMVEFKRPANSSDTDQDVAITNDTKVWIMFGSAVSDITNNSTFSQHDVRHLLPMTYNLIAMAMDAAAATDPPVTTASAAKCGGSYAVASVFLALTARFVLSS